MKHLKIWRIRSRQKIFSTGLNTFTAKQFSENHRFSLKIFKTLEGHNSLNFGRRRKFQTFLESSDKNLSKKWRFVSSYLNQKNVQSWKREKSPKTSILDEISRLGTERVKGSKVFETFKIWRVRRRQKHFSTGFESTNVFETFKILENLKPSKKIFDQL